MKDKEVLLKKFFSNACNELEAEEAIAFLLNNPDELERYISEKDWLEHIDAKQLAEPASKEILRGIVQELDKKKKGGIIRKLYYLRVAALLILAIGVSWLWVARQPKEMSKQLVQTTKSTLIKVVEKNTTTKVRIINLKDGTSIKLYPGSEISYSTNFGEKLREIHLNGKAFFSVAKDKHKPFNVFAGGLVATVLGTEFIVSSNTADAKVIVKLFSGKVLVSPDSSLRTKGVPQTMLSPGESVEMDKKSFALLYRSKSILTGSSPAKAAVNKLNEQHTILSDSLIEFRKESLQHIFSVLRDEYQVNIRYDPRILQHRTFSGSFIRNEHLVDEVLKTITQLNNLEISQQNNEIIIKRK